MTFAHDYLNELVWVKLKKPDDFLIIKETLTRIGIPSKMEKKLTQTCHILHKKGRYAIVHFKELFILDGKTTQFTTEDKDRRDYIVDLLETWGLIERETPRAIAGMQEAPAIKIIPSKEKSEWQLVSKYTVGNKGRYNAGSANS